MDPTGADLSYINQCMTSSDCAVGGGQEVSAYTCDADQAVCCQFKVN